MRIKTWAIPTAIFLFLGVILTAYLFTPSSVRVALGNNPVVKFLQPTYRSFRKIVDLPYVLYTTRPTQLPVYDIQIKTEDLQKMNAGLPTDTVKGRLTDEYKVTVKADFKSGDYEDRIKIRYRGRGPNHWNAYKKSLQVEFPVDHPLNGITELKLFIPEDRNYLIEPLNMERAKRLGLLAPEPFFVRVRMNGEDMGVYTAMSHWSTAFADRANYGETANIFGIRDFTLDELQNKNFFDPAEIAAWEDYTKSAETDPGAMTELKDFLEIMHSSSDAEFARALPAIVDMNALYTWLVLTTLGSSAHGNGMVNIVILRDPATGLMQPLPWNIDIFPMGTMSLAAHPLIGRTLAVPEFRKEFLRRFATYVHDDTMLEKDLAFYDENVKRIQPELYSDTIKIPTNYQVSRSLHSLRTHVITNYKALQKLENEGKLETVLTGRYQITPSLARGSLSPTLTKAIASEQYFLATHPEFSLTRAHTFSVGPGNVTLSGAIVLPTGTTLRIQPGTNIVFAPTSSLIVYGSLLADGSSAPITISGNHWKSIVIIAGKEHKVFVRNARFSGGSGLNQDGRTATGMLAVYGGASTDIAVSSFSDNFDDDALNVKRGDVLIVNNTFARTFGDAIDIDAGTGTIKNNTFGNLGYIANKGYGPNGDGIDTSGSTLTISENTVHGCGDKGMSVGEDSIVTITSNVIANCVIGISVKDLSRATLVDNVLIENATGVSLYQKKPLYGGATATLDHTILWNNKTSISTDATSKITSNTATIDSAVGATKDALIAALSTFTKSRALPLLK